jgi:hypothetical protein
MNGTAAHLVDRVLPEVASVRQWVLSLPHRVRYFCARDPRLLREILRIFLRAVFRFYRRLSRKSGIRKGRYGSVTAVQRFASSLGLDVHLRMLVLDGVFAWDEALGMPVFHPAPRLREADIARVALGPSQGGRAPRAARACREGRSQSRPRGIASRRLRSRGGSRSAPSAGGAWGALGTSPCFSRPREGVLCAEAEGYNVHAQVRVDAGDRQGLERLCRSLLRPKRACVSAHTLEAEYAHETSHRIE